MKNKNAVSEVLHGISRDQTKVTQDMAELYLLVAEGQPTALDQILEIIRAQSQNLTVMSTVKILARTAA